MSILPATVSPANTLSPLPVMVVPWATQSIWYVILLPLRLTLLGSHLLSATTTGCSRSAISALTQIR